MRYDEIDWFNRISDGKTVLWMSSKLSGVHRGSGYLYHATADGKVAVCSSIIEIDREHDAYPNTGDRSANTMTCDRCAALVKRIPMGGRGKPVLARDYIDPRMKQ